MYSQEVLGFIDVTASGNHTPYDDPIVSTTSPTLTPFGDRDFLLFEEADAFLGLEDDLNLPEFNPFYYDPKGDILLLEAILNSKPLPPFPNHKQYMPSYKKELKVREAKTVKSSVDEPPEVEIKDLPPHLEYAFLEGDNKLPFYEAWERFNDLLRACPHHGFYELHQLDTFYNSLNINEKESLNSAAGGKFLDKMPRECLKIIESKSKIRKTDPQLQLHLLLLLQLKQLSQVVLLAVVPTRTKIIPLQAETFIETTSKRSGTLPSNTITNPKEDLKGITTRSGVAYQGPTIPTPSKVVKQGTEPVVAPVSVPMPNLKPFIPYPSRRDNERRRNQANEQIEKFYKIFKDMSFEISFTDALILMPKFASTIKALIGNKEKLSEMARTPINEHCSAVILNKLPRKLGDPGKFLIPCEFPGMDECLALADLGASINLMPLSMWEGISLSKLTLTCMTLELADRSVSKPIGIAKDVSVKVGVFHFPADFVVVDFEPDPQVVLILGRCFLKTGRALIDVHKGELTLRIKNEDITYNLDQTSRYSANYNQMTENKIDIICEMYSQEVLGFIDVTASGNHTPYDDPIVSTTSPTLTPFGDRDFLLFEEADAFLGLEDDLNLPEFNPFYYDPKGDILLLEAILNSKPLPPFPNHKQYMPS
nr:reverse transcriptase domain-containing protein [Tanacetum cinerariifolium]